MFELANIRSGDRKTLSRAEQFLLENPDSAIRLRPQEQLERAMDTGLGLVVLRDNIICGLSLVYPFDVPPSGPVYSEIGTMRVTANGHSLQVFLAKFHLLQILVEEYHPTEAPLVFAVVTPGTASAHNMRDEVGMLDWLPPKELSAVRSAAGVPFSADKQVLLASRHSFIAAIRDLTAWHQETSIFRCPKGEEQVRIDVGWFRAEVFSELKGWSG